MWRKCLTVVYTSVWKRCLVVYGGLPQFVESVFQGPMTVYHFTLLFVSQWYFMSPSVFYIWSDNVRYILLHPLLNTNCVNMTSSTLFSPKTDQMLRQYSVSWIIRKKANLHYFSWLHYLYSALWNLLPYQVC